MVSELMRVAPGAKVLSWMDALPPRELFVSAVTEAEIRTGIAILPVGTRRRGLVDASERMLGLFAGRTLPFDSEAARTYAEIVAKTRTAGRPISQSDCQIAAIARSRGMAVATRNVRDFAGSGVEVMDPWASV